MKKKFKIIKGAMIHTPFFKDNTGIPSELNQCKNCLHPDGHFEWCPLKEESCTHDCTSNCRRNGCPRDEHEHSQPKPSKSNWEEEFDNTKFAKGGGLSFEASDYEGMYSDLKSFIRNALLKQREDILSKIDPFDLVKPCNPDCTPEEHAYHQGTWDSQLRLERILKGLKKE